VRLTGRFATRPSSARPQTTLERLTSRIQRGPPQSEPLTH
jgi:hypothetical protein